MINMLKRQNEHLFRPSKSKSESGAYISSFKQVVEDQPGIWKSAWMDALLGLNATNIRLTSLADSVDVDVVHSTISLSEGVPLI